MDEFLELPRGTLDLVVKHHVVELFGLRELLPRQADPLADLALALTRPLAQPALELRDRRGDEDRQSERASSAIRLSNGRSVPLEVITSFASDRRNGLTPEATGKPVLETGFMDLPNGGLLDLVRDSYGSLTFALFQKGSFTKSCLVGENSSSRMFTVRSTGIDPLGS